MNYLNVLKEQSAYVDQGIAKLITELGTVSENKDCDTTILQQYYEKLESLREQTKTLIKTTRLNILQEKKLQMKRKVVISSVSEYVSEIENASGIIYPSQEESVVNESVQDASLQFNNSKNKSLHLDETFDGTDIAALLNKSLPKLPPL